MHDMNHVSNHDQLLICVVSVSHSQREVAHCDFRELSFELRPTLLVYHQVLTELPAPSCFVHLLTRNCCEDDLDE